MRRPLTLALGALLAAAPAADGAAAPLEELRALAAGAPSPEAPPLPGQELDALGRPVGPETRAAFDRLLASLGGRRLSAQEQDLLLALLNQPPADPGPFKDREALVRHFAKSGVGLSQAAGQGLAGTDLWRLVRAARAASEAYRIPPALLLCLTFRESGFNREASAWTTSAKGVGQLTNAAAADMIQRIRQDPELNRETAAYAAALGARMPSRVEGAADVDALTREVEALRRSGAPAARIEAKKRERQRAIDSHKDEPGHIYNLETNFGLAAAYLAYLRRDRLPEVAQEDKAWFTAVAAYNQGLGTANELIYRVYTGAADYGRRSLDEVFSPATAARLSLTPERRAEMLGEVGSVRRCAER